MTHRVIVIGGGCAGMTAALAAASEEADALEIIVRGPLGSAVTPACPTVFSMPLPMRNRLSRMRVRLARTFTVMTVGIGRCESQGAFIRTEYPETDDARWKKNSSLTYDEEARRFDVSYVDAA